MKIKKCLSIFMAMIILLSCLPVFADDKISGEEEMLLWITAAAAISIDGEFKNLRQDREVSADEKNAALSQLADEWNVKEKMRLMDVVESLIFSGHTNKMHDEHEFLGKMIKQYFADFKIPVFPPEEEEKATKQYEYIHSINTKWGSKGVLVWDLMHIGEALYWGYLAGMITLEEMCYLFEPSAALLKLNFSSWEEAADNYMDGYAFWNLAYPTNENNEYSKRLEKIKSVKQTHPDLFDDTIWGTPLVIESAYTIPAQPEQLTGHWMLEYQNLYGETVEWYMFYGEDKTVCWYRALPGRTEFAYSSGKYGYKNGLYAIDFDFYASENGEADRAKQKDRDTDSLLFSLSEDGKQLFMASHDLRDIFTFKKSDGKALLTFIDSRHWAP